ncbi:NmrA family NAD(P)-binding protein, partial [Mycobacterium kansasii]
MKITVVGATGQIGSRVVSLLIADGHDVVAASLSSGAN